MKYLLVLLLLTIPSLAQASSADETVGALPHILQVSADPDGVHVAEVGSSLDPTGTTIVTSWRSANGMNTTVSTPQRTGETADGQALRHYQRVNSAAQHFPPAPAGG